MKVIRRIGTFITECKRVIRLLKKPTKSEYISIVKVTGLGIAIIGFMGFIIIVLKELILRI